jgi:hypothetical protein
LPDFSTGTTMTARRSLRSRADSGMSDSWLVSRSFMAFTPSKDHAPDSAHLHVFHRRGPKELAAYDARPLVF